MKCAWEHRGNDTLLYAIDQIGAYTRGESLSAAMAKMEREIASYCQWSNMSCPSETDIEIVHEKQSDLNISDADSDILLPTERAPLTRKEYEELKALVLRSASDFHLLYNSIPDKHRSCLPERKTFYGAVPRTAEEMYVHTRSVNSYYFGEIGIEADSLGTITECRKRGFDLLEQEERFLENTVTEGSYGEPWSLRKVMRRFLWHDRIHAKAMYRMALKTFGATGAANVFHFIV